MNKQFIAWPIGWELNYDRNRHSVRVFECFHNKTIPLNNDVEAFVSDSEEAAFQGLVANVKPYLDNIKMVHKTIVGGDIEFCFNCSEIKNGKVLICHKMIRRQTI
jgi:hypothetical protein